MTFQPGAVLNTQGFGSRPENVEVPHIENREPSTTDVNYPLGKGWVNPSANEEYVLTSLTVSNGIMSANWEVRATPGTLDTLSDNSNITVAPVANNIQLAGTADQITTTAGSGEITFSLIGPYTPASYTAHSVLLGEGTASIGTVGPDATSGIALISQGSSSDPIFGTVTVPGGGTGATTLTGVLIGNGTSAVTGNAVTQYAVLVGGASNAITSIADVATGQALMSGGVSANPAFTGSPSFSGSVTAATTITATLGAITATNGNLVLGTAGNKLSIATGSNASIGTSAAMTAGSITISTTAVTASSKIFLSANTPGGTAGILSAPTASIVANTSFVINSSSSLDTSTVNWWIVN